MHVIVVGCGRVGSGLASQLQTAGHSVAIVDRNKKAFRRLSPSFTGEQIVGLGFDRDVLLSAGVERAESFAAVTSGDNSNILAARIAKETFAIDHVVARIYDPRRAAIYQRLGIATVATVAWTTEQIARRLVVDQSSLWTDQSATLTLEEFEVPSVWAGQRLELLNDSDHARVVSIARAGAAVIAQPGHVGQEGDLIQVLLQSSARDAFSHRLASGPSH